MSTSDALFYVPEVELGVPLPWGATPRLIHEIGAARARQMVLTSQRVDGTTAQAWGLVHEVVEDEKELDSAVDRWTERILSYLQCLYKCLNIRCVATAVQPLRRSI